MKGILLMSAAQYSMKEPEKDPHPARKHQNLMFEFHFFIYLMNIFYLFVLFHKQNLSTYK